MSAAEKSTIRVGILGATGYTALELMKLLLRHPHVELTALTSRQEDEPLVGDVHPALVSRVNLRMENLAPADLAKRADCVFSCLPHAASAAVVAQLLEAGCRVVDFSADYRLNDIDVYEKWYQTKHPDAQRVGKVVYGLPELFGDKIGDARLVANPGCYPTSAILALAPLLKAGLMDPDDIIIDSKSGISGAGKGLSLATHYPECNESIAAYAVGSHRHTPEIEQVLSTAGGKQVDVVFTPHLTPMNRGILTTAYGRPIGDVTEPQLLETMRTFYAGKPFVRVIDQLPSTRSVSGTNYCDVTVRIVKGRIVTISVIDNLIKGASGAAVQNFNIMYGFDETTALV